MMAVKDHTIPISDEFNLIIVNRWNEIPKNYSVTLHFDIILVQFQPQRI